MKRKDLIKLIDSKIKEIKEAIKENTDNEQFDLGYMVAGTSAIEFLNIIKVELKK